MGFTEGMTAPGEDGNDDLQTPDRHSEDPSLTQTTSDPDESVAKQLRAKLSDKGRENKELAELVGGLRDQVRSQNELIQTLRSSTELSSNGGEDARVALVDKILNPETSVDESRASLLSLLDLSTKSVEDRLRTEYEQRMSSIEDRGRASRVDSFTRDFFQKEGVPELADSNSDFYKYLSEEVGSGDGFVTSLVQVIDTSPSDVVPILWDRYLNKRGVRKPKLSRNDISEHRDSILSDSPSATEPVNQNAVAELRAIYAKEGRELSLKEALTHLAKKKLV